MYQLEIKNLRKRYSGQKEDVLRGISLIVKPGEVFGFLGKNGAGKSTTLKCITGILPIDFGSVKICGYDINSNPLEAKFHFGYVSDNHLTYEEMTGREYLHFIASVYRVSNKDFQERFLNLIKLFEIEEAIDRFIRFYSLGMKQKIAIIASLIHKADLWILDEPFSGLDVGVAFQLKKYIQEYKAKGKSVFLTSHNLDSVEKICDRVAIIQEGIIKEVIDLHQFKLNSKISLEEHFHSLVGAFDV